MYSLLFICWCVDLFVRQPLLHFCPLGLHSSFHLSFLQLSQVIVSPPREEVPPQRAISLSDDVSHAIGVLAQGTMVR